jgi:hypothetical protein
MILGGIVAAMLGVNAEGKSLEDVAAPLSMIRKAADRITPSSPSVAGEAA